MSTFPHIAQVAAAIDHYSTSVSMRRHLPGDYNEVGRWTEPAPTVTTIRAAIFAVNPTQILDLPEGIREVAQYTIWTREDLRGASQETGTLADDIEWLGEWYSIIHMWPRREAGFTKALLGVSDDRGRSV